MLNRCLFTVCRYQLYVQIESINIFETLNDFLWSIERNLFQNPMSGNFVLLFNIAMWDGSAVNLYNIAT